MYYRLAPSCSPLSHPCLAAYPNMSVTACLSCIHSFRGVNNVACARRGRRAWIAVRPMREETSQIQDSLAPMSTIRHAETSFLASFPLPLNAPHLLNMFYLRHTPERKFLAPQRNKQVEASKAGSLARLVAFLPLALPCPCPLTSSTSSGCQRSNSSSTRSSPVLFQTSCS